MTARCRVLVAIAGACLWLGCVVVLVTPAVAVADLAPPDLAPMVDMQTTYGWGAAFGWPANTNPCPTAGAVNWTGVTCNRAGRVLDILGNCGATTLQSDFPSADISQLTALNTLWIRNCYLTPQPASNFSGLDSMTQLGNLQLAGDTGITGTLADIFPGGLGPSRFSNLSTFDVSDTSLGGSVPAGLVQYACCGAYRLNDAQFSGTLPAGGVSPTNLQLQGNELQGVLPDYIVNAPTVAEGCPCVHIDLDYNKFDVADTPAGSIDTIDPTWRQTQTVPPTGVQVTQTGVGSATLSWTPIAYQADGGYYEVLSSQTEGGPYTLDGTTSDSGGKSATGLTVSGLPGGTNYFVVRTFTPAHVSQPLNLSTDNPNNLTSIDSSEVNGQVQFATPSISTAQQPASAIVGGPVADTATVSGGDSPTGTVTFDLYSDANGTGMPLFTDTEPLVSGSATSNGYMPAATGTDYWVATYNGDSYNNAVSSGNGDEPVSITPSTPSISTSQQPASAVVGSAIADRATVSGGDSPSGTVTFNLYNNPNGTGTPLFTDANEPLSSGVATSKGYTTTATGTDYWVATYNGDPNNNPVGSASAGEPVTITAASKLADLKLTISGPSSANDGSSFTEKVTVTNAGPASARDVLSAVLVPGGVTVTNTGGGVQVFGSVHWTASQIAAGAKATCTITFKVLPHASGRAVIPAATASLANPDPNYANNVAVTTIVLGQTGSHGTIARRPRNPFPANKRLPAYLLRLARAHHGTRGREHPNLHPPRSL